MSPPARSSAIASSRAPVSRFSQAVYWLFPCIPLGLLSLVRFGIIDDAYISFRYARNLALGHGFVFNSHERVEGVTNFLWTVVLAGIWKIGVPLSTAAPVLGFILGVLAVREAWKSCSALRVPLWAAAAATLLVLLSAAFWLTVTSGLEGGLSAYLLARVVRAIITNERTALVGLCGGLLFLTRFDTVVVFPVYVAYLLAGHGTGRRARTGVARWKAVLLAADVGTWAAVLGAATVVRLLYFGSVIPNSVLAKRVPLQLDTLRENAGVGLAYCLLFLLLTFPICAGLLQWPRRRPALFVQAIVALEMAIVLWNGGDWMPHYRLLTVYEPLCVPFTAQLFASAASNFKASALKRAAIVVLLFFGAILYVTVFRENEAFGAPHLTTVPTEPCMNSIGRALASAVRPGDRIASEAIGIFSYDLPNTYSSDLDGLTDRTIASHGDLYIRQIGRMDPAYTFHTVRPTVIVARFHFDVVRVLAGASGGRYNADYATYEILGGDGCTGLRPVISIQRSQVARLLPALSHLGLRRVSVP